MSTLKRYNGTNWEYLGGGASLSNVFSASDENGYTQEYINGLNTYFMSEHRVGTWINGKPLYSRWFSATLTQTGLTNLQNITRNNYGVIWVNSYFTQNSLGSIMSGHYYYDSTDYQRVWIEGGNYVAFQGGSSFPRMPSTIYYELRYTKSSD